MGKCIQWTRVPVCCVPPVISRSAHRVPLPHLLLSAGAPCRRGIRARRVLQLDAGELDDEFARLLTDGLVSASKAVNVSLCFCKQRTGTQAIIRPTPAL